MASYECPRCHKPTISVARRMFLGPGTSVTCSKCGARVSVPFSSLWTVFPVLVGFLIALPFDSRPLTWLLLAIGGMVAVGLSLKFVPLIEKS